MDVRFINPFIGAVKNVFSTMLETELLISRPTITTGAPKGTDVAAVIRFIGDGEGTVALCFPQRTAVNTASKFAGTLLGPDDPDFADALGELANMVAGQAKAQLEGLNASISLPRVLMGNDLRTLHPRGMPALMLPCDSGLGRFSTEVTMAVTRHTVEIPAVAAVTSAS